MNQENKKQIIVAGVLGVVLVIVLIYQFAIAGGSGPPAVESGSNTQMAANTPAPAAPPRPATRLKKVDVNLEELQEKVQEVTFRYESERISRSPMTPLVGRIRTSTGELPTVGGINLFDIAQKNVTGIVYNDFKPVAIVDDVVVSEGYRYPDGVEVARIEPKRVWFKWGDNEIPVELKEL